MTRAVLLLALWAGCGAGDPCDGKSGTCVSVRLIGSVQEMDQIAVDVTSGGMVILRGNSALQSPLVTLPVQFAVRFSTPTRGTVTLAAVGRRVGSTVARGSGSVSIPTSGRASITIAMFPSSDVDFAVPPDLFERDALDLAGTDLASGVTLTPALLELGAVTVGARTTDSFTLDNNSALSHTITRMAVDALADYAIDPSSTCQVNGTLGSGGSCTVVVVFAPTRPQSRTLAVTVELGPVTVVARVHGRSPGWFSESIASAPELHSLGGTAGDDIWAGGDGALFHFGAGGEWAPVVAPAGAGRITSIHAISRSEIYLAASTAEIYRTVDGGASWQTAIVPAAAGAFQALASFGLDVYAGTDSGAIARGTFAAWNADGAVGSGVLQFALIGTSFTALTSSGLFTRGAPSVWTPLLDLTSQAQLKSMWGSAPTNYFVGGRLAPCEMSPCGVVFHYSGTLRSAVVAGCEQVNSLFNLPSGEIWAAGQGGTLARSFGSDTFTRDATAPVGATVELRAVWGSDSDLVAVGSGGTIAHRY